MLVIKRFTFGKESCVYLPTEQSELEYVAVLQLSETEYENRMNQGWRKFGALLFHPVCPECTKCRPIRIPVAGFTPNRSQIRALKRNEDLTIRCGKPVADRSRLLLYHQYHAFQTGRKGWPASSMGMEEYAFNYLENPIETLELTIWLQDRLVGVMLMDLTPNVISDIYHFYDLSFRERGLGTFLILQSIELARKLGKPFVYLGYYVEGSPSMIYKARFKPCELLNTRGHWDDFTKTMKG